MPGTMASSLATKLFGTALSRIGGMAFQKVVRLRKVDATIKGGKLTNAAIATALSDFEIVTGSYRGELTESLADFLRELERTGLVGALAEQASIKKHCPATKQAFLTLHEQFFPAGIGDPEALYSRVVASFEASMELLIKDAALGQLVKSTSNEIFSRLESMDSRLAGALSGSGKTDIDSIRLC